VTIMKLTSLGAPAPLPMNIIIHQRDLLYINRRPALLWITLISLTLNYHHNHQDAHHWTNRIQILTLQRPRLPILLTMPPQPEHLLKGPLESGCALTQLCLSWWSIFSWISFERRSKVMRNTNVWLLRTMLHWMQHTTDTKPKCT
jgi:hypothetical protein